jgi:diguanylate cyclase (GGDEF)-like protein
MEIDNINAALEKLLLNKPLAADGTADPVAPVPAEAPGLDEIWEKVLKLQAMHKQLQSFSVGLAKGELATEPPPRNNYLAAGLKQLQMHLRHLSWQTQRISEGDYSQKVDFMGEFSEAFNKMVERLHDREEDLLAQRETMLQVFDLIEPVLIVSAVDPTVALYANKMAKLRFHLEDESQSKLDLLHSFSVECPPGTNRQIQDKDSGRWYRVSCESFFWDAEQDSLLYHCVDITSHVQRESDLEQAAHTDKLTGLNNRYVFERSFDILWDTCLQNKRNLSIIFFDIDFFKQVNDSYGHLQGDRCLVALADVMRAHIGRFNDVIARFGGEEFVALLPFTNREAAGMVAEAVRCATEALEIPMTEKGQHPETIRITVSGGVASIVPTFDDIKEELIAAADKALYEAKQTGRNKICLAGPSDE